jgi:transcriptional regulator NrdR family protein
MRICPRCGADSRVLETREIELSFGPALRRRRACARDCGWRMSTAELPLPLVGSVHDPIVVSASLLRRVSDTVRVMLERQVPPSEEAES